MKKMFTDIFIKFINGECTEESLIIELEKLEKIIQSKRRSYFDKNNIIWFRFFDDDCLVTTITNIQDDLKSATNHDYIMECIRIGVENDSIVVNFS